MGELASGCRLTALLIAAMLAVAGCGGSSKAQPSGSVTESRPTKESAGANGLIAKADAICRRLNVELAATASTGSEAHQLALSAPRHAALERHALAQLGKLAVPASLARDWRQILAYRQTLAEELVKLARYAKTNDTRAIQALGASKKRVHQKLTELATRDGFKDCSTIGAGGGLKQLFHTLRPAHRGNAPIKPR